MSNTITDIIVQFQNEAVAYDQKARKANGSDRKVFRKLSGLTKDHAATVQEGFMLAFTRPLMELITPEFAKTLVANARETNRGVGQAFKDSANNYIQHAAQMETQTFGGVVFTKSVLEYLNLVNWGYLGQYIEMVAGDVDIDAPIPKTCGRQDCKVLEQRVADGWIVVCETCKRGTSVKATKPQAVQEWNGLDFEDQGAPVKRSGLEVVAEAYDAEESAAYLSKHGFAVTPGMFESWSPDDQGKALNYVATGGKIARPAILDICDNAVLLDTVNKFASVPEDVFAGWTAQDRLAAYNWARSEQKNQEEHQPSWEVPSHVFAYLSDGK